MLAQTDKRSHERIASNASIIFSLFNTRFWRDYPSMTRNHSENGMCYESSLALTPGTHLFIRVDKQPDSGSSARLSAKLSGAINSHTDDRSVSVSCDMILSVYGFVFRKG